MNWNITVIASASLLQGQVASNLPEFVAEALGLANDAERALAICEVGSRNYHGAGGDVAARAFAGERAIAGDASPTGWISFSKLFSRGESA